MLQVVVQVNKKRLVKAASQVNLSAPDETLMTPKSLTGRSHVMHELDFVTVCSSTWLPSIIMRILVQRFDYCIKYAMQLFVKIPVPKEIQQMISLA